MSTPCLAIIQARMGSTRLPGKMLLPIGGETLIERVHRLTCEAFGAKNTVVAYPDTPENAPLVAELDRIGAQRFGWNGPEDDVLGRYYHCAHAFRWRPETVIIRVTPDDPFKDPAMMRRVARGERLPVELGGEAFTLSALDDAHARYQPMPYEHLTYAIFPTYTPPPPPGVWSIDTPEDYEAVCKLIQHQPFGRGTGDLSDPQMGELHDISPFDGGPWRPC